MDAAAAADLLRLIKGKRKRKMIPRQLQEIPLE
jgi:hypothetical protein